MDNLEEQQPNKIKVRLIVGILIIIAVVAVFSFIQTGRNTPESSLQSASFILDEGVANGAVEGAVLQARELLLAVERTGYSSAYLYDLLGYSAEIISDYDRALEYYNKAVAIDPKSVRSLLGIGNSYLFKGDAEKAKEYYDKAETAISISTDNFVKERVYSAQGKINTDPRKSEEYFLKALNLSSLKAFKAESYANLSNARYLQNDLPKAVEYAELAVKTDPSSALGYIAYAKAIISDKTLLQENAKKVEEYLIKAVFLAPRSAESQYWVGKLDTVFGKYDLAIKSYDTAAKFLMKDNTMSVQAKASLMSDIFFDESIAYFFKKDSKYKEFFREAFRLDPAKTLFRARDNPALKDMMTDFVS